MLNHGTLPDSVKEGTQIALCRQRRCADDDKPNSACSAERDGPCTMLDASDKIRTALKVSRALVKKVKRSAFFISLFDMVVGFAKRFQRIGFAYRLPLHLFNF